MGEQHVPVCPREYAALQDTCRARASDDRIGYAGPKMRRVSLLDGYIARPRAHLRNSTGLSPVYCLNALAKALRDA